MYSFRKLIPLSLFLVILLIAYQTRAEGQDQDRLLGIWGSSPNENANFEILKDSIYYPDDFAYVKYTTKGDSIFIDYDGAIYKAKYLVRNDTLTMIDKNNIDVFIRFK